MKKIIFSGLLFFVLTITFSQSHIFKFNRENANEGYGWGSWVKSTTNVGVTALGDGNYK